jgi:hypothetical protein
MLRPQPDMPSGTIPYEQRLAADFEWALREGSMHFDESSSVHRSLRQIAQRLEALGVPYAVCDAMALFFHGHRRFTEDVDVLVSRDALKKIHDGLKGRGYVSPFVGSKNLRDAETGVAIEFIVQGDYPGDGKPKPIAFPDPAAVSVDVDGIRFLSLPALIELKLASGMTNPRRGQDLVDVQALIDHLELPLGFAEGLHPFVRGKFAELWHVVHDNPP